jgi:hypothetical protein
MTLKPISAIQELHLNLGPTWTSFEKFRIDGAKQLEQVHSGHIGTLLTKTGQFRVLAERDFQQLLGLAKEIDRVRGGLRVVISAARVVQQHPDSSSMQVLMDAVSLLGELPILPTQTGHTPLELEDLDELEEDDEIISDPALIPRALGKRS